jgi:hypothetical protein
VNSAYRLLCSTSGANSGVRLCLVSCNSLRPNERWVVRPSATSTSTTVIQQAFHSTARESSFDSESLPSLTVSLCISSPQAYDAQSSFNNFSLSTTYPFQLTSSSVRDDHLMRLKPSSLMSNTEPRNILFPFIIWVAIPLQMSWNQCQ